jgi:hypothetical protein
VSGRNLDFAWYQGVKISLFDVSDVENPIEKAKYVIGDRGTDSPILSDHKALLFDKDKKLLVIPISLAKINRSKYKECSESELNSPYSYNNCLTPHTYGEQVWQGAYVFNIDLSGIELKGRISHYKESDIKYGPALEEPIGAERIDKYGNVWTKYAIKSPYETNPYSGMPYNPNVGKWKTDNEKFKETVYDDYTIDTFPGGINYQPYYDYSSQIQRSLYIGEYLYTVSQSKIKANELSSLTEIRSVDLGYEDNPYTIYYE